MLLIMVSLAAHALDPTLKLSQYVLDNWQIPQGLPQSSAQAIARTPDGYLWVGTQEGLARFDGVRFVVFDHANEAAIPDKHISVLYVDTAGRLWIGTRAGIALYEHGHIETLNVMPTLAHAYVRAIAQGKQGRIWVGTESGLFGIGDGTAVSFDSTSGLPDSRIRALLEDREGVLWVGTAAGSQRFDGNRFQSAELRRSGRRANSRPCIRMCRARFGWEPITDRSTATRKAALPWRLGRGAWVPSSEP